MIIKLIPPLVEELKLNFDRATKGNSKVLKVGCIVRDSNRRLVTTYSKILSLAMNSEAEAQSFLLKGELCKAYNISNAHIEGD